MTTQYTEPIVQDWTRTVGVEPASGLAADELVVDELLVGGCSIDGPATARRVAELLAQFEVHELDQALVPFLAAGGAELAAEAGISWRFSTDDPPVALLRLIAKVSIVDPAASGPHAGRLVTQLEDRLATRRSRR